MSVRGTGWIAAAVALASLATAGHAALGRPRASIEDDRAHLAATMAVADTGVAHVAMLRPTAGGTIREYSNADGTVFAVVWRGRSRPDLRQLLGDRFEAASSEMARPRGRRTARMIAVERDDIVMRSEGRPGAFSGAAYDPRLVPAGFSLDDLH